MNLLSLFSLFVLFVPSWFRNVAYAFGFFGLRVSLPPLSFLPMCDTPFTFPYHRTFRRGMQRACQVK